MLHSYIDFPKQNVPNNILTILASQAISVSSSHVHVLSLLERTFGLDDDVRPEAMWVMILTVTLKLTFVLCFETASHSSPG